MIRDDASIYSRKTASGAARTGKCILSSLTIAGTDASATAGTIQVYDGTDDTGTLIYQETVAAAAYTPKHLIFNVIMNLGVYVKFTTTNDVQVVVATKSY